MSRHSPAGLQPDRNLTFPGNEYAVTRLAQQVDLVIGVDTHKHTHTAAIVDAVTGGKVSELTASTDPGGYGELLAWADAARSGSRTWSLEGGGGYGAGLARFLVSAGERVVELDGPKRAVRRHGAKSDSLDAVRAAREALGRVHLAEVKSDGPRAELAALMAAAGQRARPRRSHSGICTPWSSRPRRTCAASCAAPPRP